MGKLAIPEHILNKPGKLTPAEFDTMKQHADIGADLLSSIRFPYPVVPIVRHHHESWNGTGYPTGIAGTDIPLGARILSVVDCFDALTSDRPYRPRLSKEEAFKILRDRSGVMYDPLVVDTFIGVFDEIAPGAIKAGQLAKSIATFHDDTNRVEERVNVAVPKVLTASNAGFSIAQRRLLQSPSVDAALVAAFALIRQFTPANVCAWFEYQHDRDTYRCARVFGDSSHLLRGLTIRNGERVTGWAGANRRTAANSDAVLDLGPLADLFSPTLRSAVSCPIRIEDAAPGVLTVYSGQHEGFAVSHIDAVEQICESLALRMKSKGASEVLI
jgi:hypothetical protein